MLFDGLFLKLLKPIVENSFSLKSSQTPSLKKLQKRARYFAGIGCARKSLQILSSGGIAPANNNTEALLRSKHPANDEEIPELNPSVQHRLVVDVDIVRKVIAEFDPFTGSGQSGLSIRFIITCLSAVENHPAFAQRYYPFWS